MAGGNKVPEQEMPETTLRQQEIKRASPKETIVREMTRDKGPEPNPAGEAQIPPDVATLLRRAGSQMPGETTPAATSALAQALPGGGIGSSQGPPVAAREIKATKSTRPINMG